MNVPHSNRREWTARHWLSGEWVRVVVEGGKIVMVAEAEPSQLDRADTVRWIAPALIDVQLNGINGIDFNDPNAGPEQLREAVRYLYSRGVVRFCPTVVTSDREGMNRCIRTIADACEAYPEVAYAVVGIHVEGPFISAEPGPLGAHPRECVRDPEWRDFLEWQACSGGRIAKVTLAPERTGAVEFIRGLAAEGVVAAIGHTNASEQEIMRAVEAGATMSTHLGNGSHPVLPRHPNYIWTQLAHDGLYAGLIGDGHHLPDAVLKSMIRVKGPKAILVSDANHFEGFPPGRYLKRNRHEVILEPSGRLVMADNPKIFSGAATPLNRCVAHVAGLGICTLGEAIEMASLRPAELFGLDRQGIGRIAPGSPADLIVYSHERERPFYLWETVAKGQTVYSKM